MQWWLWISWLAGWIIDTFCSFCLFVCFYFYTFRFKRQHRKFVIFYLATIVPKQIFFCFFFVAVAAPIIHADFTYILSLPGHSSQHAYPQPHQRSILHSVQKVRLGRHEIPVDSFQRRVFTAAKSLWWCSLMPVLIWHSICRTSIHKVTTDRFQQNALVSKHGA